MTGRELAWRQWQGELVVFNPISGATHLLDIASAEIFHALMAGSTRRGDLAGRLADLLEVDCDDGVRAATDRILARLDDLGLAEPAAA